MPLLKKIAPLSHALMFRSGLFFIAFFLCLILGLTTLAPAASLQWDSNDDADYYVVYWRTADDAEPIANSEPIPADAASLPLYEPSDGTKYIFTVKAFNDFGNSSDFSDEIISLYSPYQGDAVVIEEPPDTYTIDIILPEEGLLIESGVLTDFSANIYMNDSLVIFNNVIWTSGIDGQIGTGPDICVGLSAGIHTIMASLTNDQGEMVADTMTLTVLENNMSPVIQITQAVRGDVSEKGQVFTLTGSASDEEDGDLSGNIIWLSDVDGGLGMGAAIVATLTPGTHVITARVADSHSQQSETSLTVTADIWNTPPSLTINASTNGDITSQGEQIYVLSGTAQDAEDGNLSSSISWTSSLDGVLGTASPLTVSLSSGTHILTASVTDSKGKTTDKQLTVVVTPYNYPPEISISASAAGTLGPDGQAFALSGSANDIEDGDISASISWSSDIDGPLGTGALVETLLSSGVHALTASVSDSRGQKTDFQITVTVDTYNFSPELTITTTAIGALGANGQDYSLTGTATDTEDGDLSDNIIWTSDIGGPLGTGSSLTVILISGTHTITASVTDSPGSQTAVQKVLQINTFNNAPEISITTAPNGTLGPDGMAYVFTGSAKDAEDGDLSASIVWTSDAGKTLGEGASIATTLASGTHTIIATVTDSSGKQTSIQKTLTVEAYNYAPQLSITASADGTLGPDGQAFLLTGTATDREDGDLSAAIVWVSGTGKALGTGASIDITLATGTHTLIATVTDSSGKQTSIQKTVTVDAYNYAPEINIEFMSSGAVSEDGQPYTLTGTATDSEDGDLSGSIVWVSSLDGNLGIGANLGVTLSSGAHTITASVTDSKGVDSVIKKTITVEKYNNSPELRITTTTAGELGAAGQPYTLSGTATDPEDGDLSAAIAWTSSVDGELGQGASLQVTLSPGAHNLSAQVTDSLGKTASILKTLTVSEYNTPPVITLDSAIPGVLGPEGQPYSFASSASDQEDGDLSASITWSSTIEGHLGTGASITPTLPPGSHTITARISDSMGETAEAHITITVEAFNYKPELTIALSSNGSVTPEGQPCLLSGTARDFEDGDLSSSIVWESNLDGTLGTGSGVNATLSFGAHTITASVTDTRGQSVSEQRNITVDTYNYAPEINITAAVAGTLTAEGQPYSLSATASDNEDGDLSPAIVWASDLDGPLGTGSGVNATLSSGTHAITASVADSRGLSAVAKRTLTVDSFNYAPEIAITGAVAGSLTAEGQPYSLSATASDNEDGDLSSAIVWESDLDGPLGTGSKINPTLSSGTHSITASVRDSLGKSAVAQRTLTIGDFNNAPEITMTAVVAGTLTAEGQPYSLSASASDKEEGDISSAIVWKSDLDGALGTGSEINVTLSSGTHIITASITDSLGLSSVDQRTVTIGAFNNAPEINITAIVAGTLTTEGQSYSFSATAYDNEDGDLGSTIIWTSSLAGAIGTGKTLSVTLTSGVHMIRAQVTDSGGKSNSLSREIVVENYDFVPSVTLVNATEGDQNDTGQFFEFTASASDTEDGDLSAGISWTSSLQGVLGTGSTLKVHLVPGKHTVVASVEDSFGNVAKDDMTVTSVALDYPPTLSPIQAESGKATRDGQLFTFSCTATDHEDGDLSSSVVWVSSALGELGTGPAVQAVIPLGQHTVTARVSDSFGQSTESTKELTAVWVNQDPVVHIRSIEPGASGKEGQVYTFTGDAIDEEDGDLSTNIIWTSSLIGELGRGAEVMVTLSEGTHTITARISDQDDGQSQTSTLVKIAQFNVPPLLEISLVIAKEATEQGQTFELSASATDDEDGDISDSIVWSSDLDGVLGTGPHIVTELSDGDHSVLVSATDSLGKQTSQSITVVSVGDKDIQISVSSSSFYYFKIITVTWSGASSDVNILKNGKPIGTGGPEGTKYFWFAGSGRYKVCEMDGGECSEEIIVK